MEFHKTLFELPYFLVGLLYPKIYYKRHFFVCLFVHYMPSSPIITSFCFCWFKLYVRQFKALAYSIGIYLIKVYKWNIHIICEICSTLIVNTPERCHWCLSGVLMNIKTNSTLVCASVSISDFEQVNAGCLIHYQVSSNVVDFSQRSY